MDPIPAQDVILHEEAGEAFLLHVPSGRYFGLNRAGLVVWESLVSQGDPMAALSARWPAVSEQRLRADLTEVMAALEQAGLVRRGTEPAAAPE